MAKMYVDAETKRALDIYRACNPETREKLMTLLNELLKMQQAAQGEN